MRFQKTNSGFSPLSFSFSISNRTLWLTREGVFFIILTIGIGFGAINTGINLLYLILAMCLSFIIVSGILSEITLRHLSVTRKIPAEIFAQEPFPVRVEIKNNKKWFPTYSVWLEEDVDFVDSHGTPLQIQSDIKNMPKLYCYHVKAGELENKNMLCMFPKRGLFKTNGIKISTRYPFGFFIKTALFKKTEERVVYPPIRDLDGISSQLASIGETISSIKGEGSDIFGFRGFAHGDSSKMIHWKTSAKVNNLMVKEHFMEENPKVAIIFDNKVDAEQTKRDSYKVKFDNGVSQAASLANHFIRDGCEVEIITRNRKIPFGSGYNHLSEIFYHLALLEPVYDKTDRPLEIQDMNAGIIHLSYAGEYL
tara:strand:- start:4008 stop:5105 length:1098 start_codon:yes stop_codon:yes gene_type:complete